MPHSTDIFSKTQPSESLESSSNHHPPINTEWKTRQKEAALYATSFATFLKPIKEKINGCSESQYQNPALYAHRQAEEYLNKTNELFDYIEETKEKILNKSCDWEQESHILCTYKEKIIHLFHQITSLKTLKRSPNTPEIFKQQFYN